MNNYTKGKILKELDSIRCYLEILNKFPNQDSVKGIRLCLSVIRKEVTRNGEKNEVF